LTPSIIFVPGLKPKPPPAVHRAELMRVLSAALERVRPRAALRLGEHPQIFSLAAWTHLLYGSYRDIALDLPGIERLVRQPAPSASDLKAMDSWAVRITRWRHLVGDGLPFFGRWLAQPALRSTMLEAGHYLSNRDGVARAIRATLDIALRRAWEADERVLLIGHSLGSVIAYDTLWELSHGREPARGRLDLFVTLGSPLATKFIRRSVRGADADGANRYPLNVRRWANFSAKGDLTALHPRLEPHFREMLELELVESIEDCVDLENHFHTELGLNVHEAYGYLANPHVARVIGDWLEAAG
jgi:hypothetical protein